MKKAPNISRFVIYCEEIFRVLPNFQLSSELKISKDFLWRSLADFHSAVAYVSRLPYRRNYNRADYNLVFKEECGTCSTKHALLAALVKAHRQPVLLTLGII